MKIIIYSVIAVLFFSCAAPGTVTLTPVQLEPESTASAPLDTLAAYRKYPGSPKTEYVQGYYRKDSTFVNGYWRS